MRHRRVFSLISAGLIIGASVLVTAAPTAAHDNHGPHVQVLLDGLSSPKGIAIASSKSVAVSQGAYGPPAGPVLEFFYKGPSRGTSHPLTGDLSLVDIAATPDGAGWGIGADRILYRQAPGGTPMPVLDIAAYQAADPDPYDQDDVPGETNPFGLAALPNNSVLLADAAGNDVIRVKPDGTATTVARWKLELVKTDKVGDPTLPPKLPAEAVPTSIAIGRDGWAYVGQLMGFPGRPGSAHIWRVNPYGHDAVCTAARWHRNCQVWKSGFTSIIDLAFDRHGTLYVYEIARKGWLAFEEGFTDGVPTGPFPPAVLLKVDGHDRHEIAKGKLSQPGGIAVARDGTVFVTDGMFTGGRLLKIN